MTELASGNLLVLGTGGTISGSSDDPADNIGYQAGKIGIEDLLARLPGNLLNGVQTEQLAQIDSRDMDSVTWLALAQRVALALADPGIAGIVISHGTDTLEETAYFLHRVLVADKPVVLTGSMRPATAILSDGSQNLADAISVASTKGMSGVTVAFAGVVHSAAHLQKMHTYRLDAFGSGDCGPIGYVEEGRLRLVGSWPASDPAKRPIQLPPTASWPRVEILLNHAGADGRLALSMIGSGVAGIVIAGTGNGSISTALEAALGRCVESGIRVLRVSRCPWGPLISQPEEEFPGANGLTAAKARIELMLDLIATP